MRISFVGKGGSRKENYVKNVVLFDADINSHVGKSIGMDKIELGDRIEELRKIF